MHKLDKIYYQKKNSGRNRMDIQEKNTTYVVKAIRVHSSLYSES